MSARSASGRIGLAKGLALLMAAAAPPASAAEVDLAAEIELEYAVGLERGRSQTLALSFEPRLDVALGAGVRLRTRLRLTGDAFDRIDPGDPPPTETSQITRARLIGSRAAFELRELFVEVPWGPLYLTLGKQQVVWGEADGLKLLDVVDPQNFDEFILPDFEDSRIPLWTVNAELDLGGPVLQLLWIPDPSFHEIPNPEGLFAFRSPILLPAVPPGIPVEVRDAEQPRSFAGDSDLGARLSGFWRGVDWSLNYLYQYDDLAIPFREVVTTPAGPLAVVRPGYRRTHVIGGTAATGLGDFTLRGEVLFSSDRFFVTRDPTDTDGVAESEVVAYVLGVDWTGLPRTFASVQVFQDFALEDVPGLVRDATETNVTLFVRRSFLNERLSLESIWIHNVRRGDGLVRPSLRYEIRDDLHAWAGLDLFYGSGSGLFGQFAARDRFVFGLRWGIRAPRWEIGASR